MKVFVAGIDGYLGWSLARHLAGRGAESSGADRFLRRAWVEEMGPGSVVPIAPMPERLDAFRSRFGRDLRFFEGDLCDYRFVRDALGRVLDDLTDHRSEILKRQSVFVPDIRWNAARRPVSARPVADDAMDKSR